MLIEIGTPSCLPLGLARVDQNNELKTCLLGITLQHPPVHLSAQAHTGLKITGARADIGYDQAIRFLQYYQLKHQAEVEIELAIPAFVGLGSETMLGLTVAQALSWLNDLSYTNSDMQQWMQALNLEPQNALELYSFERGGLLLVESETLAPAQVPALLRRQEITHEERHAWAFVFLFPRVPKGTLKTVEADRLAALVQASSHLSRESGHLVTEDMWTAVANDDIAAFGRSLMALQQMNQTALANAGTPFELSVDEQAVLDLMRDFGAAAWGKCMTGLGLYALVRGGDTSRTLRKRVQDHVGIMGGIVMATITDNVGMRHTIKDKNLHDNKLGPVRVKK
ncbi:MAG: hypothetical protein GY943_12465 [Chloroflexi bacterium]|nr:hypothetical protein [Chloroflexota bacterium]